MNLWRWVRRFMRQAPTLPWSEPKREERDCEEFRRSVIWAMLNPPGEWIRQHRGVYRRADAILDAAVEDYERRLIWHEGGFA